MLNYNHYTNTYSRIKFSCVTMNSQNQEFRPQYKHNGDSPSLLLVNYCFCTSQVTLKSSHPKVGNRYILSFQPNVGNMYICDDNVFCFHIFLFFFQFVLEKVVILIGSRALIGSYATHVTVCILVSWAII